MTTRIKQDRTRKAGYRGSLNAQDFPHRAIDPRAMLATQTTQYLNQLAWWTARGCEPPQRLVVAVRASCAALREWCEGNQEK